MHRPWALMGHIPGISWFPKRLSRDSWQVLGWVGHSWMGANVFSIQLAQTPTSSRRFYLQGEAEEEEEKEEKEEEEEDQEEKVFVNSSAHSGGPPCLPRRAMVILFDGGSGWLVTKYGPQMLRVYTFCGQGVSLTVLGGSDEGPEGLQGRGGLCPW